MNRRNAYRTVHLYYLTQALLRGPRYLVGYLVRRWTRQASWRATRNWK